MRPDPGEQVQAAPVRMPRSSGPGSGKEAWRHYALYLMDANESLAAVIAEQSATIATLKAEIELLRGQVATRQPPGAHPRLSDDKTARIESALARGESTRTLARQFHVSHTTVARIGKRAERRKALIRNI